MFVLAAFAGTLSRVLLFEKGLLPEPVALLIAISLVFLMFRLFGKRFTPVASMTLVPFVVPADDILLMPILTAIGAAYLILMARLCFIRDIWIEEKS